MLFVIEFVRACVQWLRNYDMSSFPKSHSRRAVFSIQNVALPQEWCRWYKQRLVTEWTQRARTERRVLQAVLQREGGVFALLAAFI
jgi:hypothetical protein